METIRTDFLIIGAGIIGLTMAMNLRHRYPDREITIIEKEKDVAFHASGRNSGVLHAGFYYTSDSLKARFTREGCLYWQKYCTDNGLSLNRCGKVVVARGEEELKTLHELKNRGDSAGVNLKLIDEKELADLEPRARTHEKALFSPDTATVNPVELCRHLKQKLRDMDVHFFFNTPYTERMDDTRVRAGERLFQAERVINSAGLYADRIARDFGLGSRYTIIPFKGIYLEYSGEDTPVSRNIYPVPDLNRPFLGVHFTVQVDGSVKIGPTAIPSFWRENYSCLSRFSAGEFLETSLLQTWLMATTRNSFRTLAVEEIKKYRKEYLRETARNLVRGVDMKGFSRWGKPGIRAQLLDRKTGQLVMDFVVENGENSVHILNAVSPAFTASYPFTRWIVDNYL